MREMALSDWTSGINFARKEGWRDGKLEGWRDGKLEGKLETAANLKAMGISMGQVAQATGLSTEDIAKL
jgi:predicted transposase/invertase (TIGR01784 family)